jgi:hypothetical protein
MLWTDLQQAAPISVARDLGSLQGSPAGSLLSSQQERGGNCPIKSDSASVMAVTFGYCQEYHGSRFHN